MSKPDGNWEKKMLQTQKTLIFWKIWLTDFCNFLIQQPFYYRTIPWTFFSILMHFLRCFCVLSFLSQSAAPVYCVVKLRMFSKFACVLCICMFCQFAVVWALESQHQIKGQRVAKHILKAPFTCPQVEVRYVYMFSGCYQGKTLKFQGGITSQSALINVECALFLHERPLACVYADCDYLTAAKTPVEKEREGEWSGGKSEHNGGKKEAWHDYDESNYSRGIVKVSTPFHCN